jgi:hypothetical protein
MKPIYSEVTDPITGEITILADLGEGRYLSIPTDPANSDYQRYLNPEAEQSTPIDTGDE